MTEEDDMTQEEADAANRNELRNKILVLFAALALTISAIYAPSDTLDPRFRNFMIYGVPSFVIARFMP